MTEHVPCLRELPSYSCLTITTMDTWARSRTARPRQNPVWPHRLGFYGKDSPTSFSLAVQSRPCTVGSREYAFDSESSAPLEEAARDAVEVRGGCEVRDGFRPSFRGFRSESREEPRGSDWPDPVAPAEDPPPAGEGRPAVPRGDPAEVSPGLDERDA